MDFNKSTSNFKGYFELPLNERNVSYGINNVSLCLIKILKLQKKYSMFIYNKLSLYTNW